MILGLGLGLGLGLKSNSEPEKPPTTCSQESCDKVLSNELNAINNADETFTEEQSYETCISYTSSNSDYMRKACEKNECKCLPDFQNCETLEEDLAFLTSICSMYVWL